MAAQNLINRINLNAVRVVGFHLANANLKLWSLSKPGSWGLKAAVLGFGWGLLVVEAFLNRNCCVRGTVTPWLCKPDMVEWGGKKEARKFGIILIEHSLPPRKLSILGSLGSIHSQEKGRKERDVMQNSQKRWTTVWESEGKKSKTSSREREGIVEADEERTSFTWECSLSLAT